MADLKFHNKAGSFRLDAIAELSDCHLNSDFNHVEISDVSSLSEASKGHLTFLDNIKYKNQLGSTKATACIVHPDLADAAPADLITLISKNPYKSYAIAASMFYPYPNVSETKIANSAVVSQTAVIGKGCIIEANSYIGDNVKIGDNCHIGSNASITHSIIGSKVRIHSGARIGQDGFGFAISPEGFLPVPQLGRVIIQDGVNIGANTCIDRGSGPDTIIGEGTYIDNLVQIGHNVNIGKGCILVAQVGISGSTVIKDYCVFGGQSGVAGHLKIGAQVQVAAQSGVTKDLKTGEKVIGFPARPIREFWREMAKLKKLLSK